MKISIIDLEDKIKSLLLKAGMNKDNAEKVTDIYMRATYRGVEHHDIYDLLGRIKQLKENKVTANPQYHQISRFGAIECYDGDNALGELNSYFIVEKSMELAGLHGIGLCTIRNSNHFLSAAPFVELAEEEKFLTVIMSKSPGGLSLPGANKNITGNNPFGYATGYNEGKILFDICCAYSSFGKMRAKAKNDETVPEYWGNDKEGNPSSNPKEILDSGLYMPIGEHKGFGIALLIELLTAVIGEGAILNQGIEDTGYKGKCTQTAISIDIGKIMDVDMYTDRVQQMVNILRQLYPDVYIPGQRSVNEKEKVKEIGYFELSNELIDKMNAMLNDKA